MPPRVSDRSKLTGNAIRATVRRISADAAGPVDGSPCRIQVLKASLPGRLRISVEGLFRNSELAARLEELLEPSGPVHSVSIQSLTGNVLLTFDPAVSHEQVLQWLSDRIGDETAAWDRGGAVGSRRHAAKSKVSTKPGRRLSKKTGRVLKKAPGPSAVRSGSGWHTMTAKAVLTSLESDSLDGIAASEARRRLSIHGANRVAEHPPASPLLVLGRQFASLPVGLLLGAAAASVATGGIADAAITLSVVATNAGIGFVTESGSERIIRSMTGPQTSHVPVIRDGREQLLEHEDLVPGDLLVLRPNTVIMADARLIDCEELHVNEALLTGESEPVAKSADFLCTADAPVADRINIVHKGSFVVSGSARAVVVATGALTEVGTIQSALGGVETPKTPLERDLDGLGQKLATISVVACGAFFATGSLRGRALTSMLKSAIALAVAAVPEGLPATATSTLALGLRRLRQKGVVVRRLSAVEGLGSLQVVCFDKTGTLTENRMRLECVHVGVEDRILNLADMASSNAATRPLSWIHEISVLCSEVAFIEGTAGLQAAGSSTETALAEAALASGVDPIVLRGSRPLLELSYRTESKRYMRSVHGEAGKARRLVAVKGDPHQVLGLCRRVCLEDGRTARLSEEDRRRIGGAVDDLAGRAYRVLGFAYVETFRRNSDPEDLIWAGAAALKDPVAPGVRELMVNLRRAGIRPIMITGDQSATAEAVAAEVGLAGDRPLRVLDSGALDKVPPELLTAIAQRTDVFARVPPTKKLRIVEALQGAGLVVGMSGDGFNDAPALKAADIAIAVGAESASAARDVADVIVGDRQLGAIANGVEQGRTILSNIRKSIHYIISTNMSEIIVLLAESAVANDELETPMELLWLNLVTDILPGLGLALEPPERNVMTRPPRSSEEALLSLKDLRHAALESGVIGTMVLGAHGYGLARYGPGPHTRTVTFLSLVMSQLLHALACRYDRFVPLGGRTLFGNSRLNAALAGAAALQAVAIVSPGMRGLLGIAAPRGVDLAVAGGTSLAAFAVNEAILAARSRTDERR